MLRITRRSSEKGDILLLEGKLVTSWVNELEACLMPHSVQKPILLDLASLTFCDEAGIRCLRTALERGARVIACSGYLQTLLWGDRTCLR
jgi:hypothetical protein